MAYQERLLKIMQILSINQTQLAASVGLSRSVISEFVNGSREPSKEFVFGLPKLGINIDWFVTGQGAMFREYEIEPVIKGKDDAESDDEKIKLDTVSNLTAPGSEKSATVAYSPDAGHKNDTVSFSENSKSDTMTDLTWKERMARIRDILGVEAEQVPFHVGYSDHGLIWGLSNGKTKAPTPEELRDIIRVFELNPSWIETGQGPVFRKGSRWSRLERDHRPAPQAPEPTDTDDLQALPFQGADALQDPGAFLIPLIDQPVSAGGGTELNGHDNVHSFIPVPKALRRYGKRLAAVPVRGDSMEPTIYHDDMVVCDTCGWEGDGIYVLRMRDGAYVKRLAVRPQGLRVISDNKAYDAYDVNPEADGVAVVGRVRCILRVVR